MFAELDSNTFFLFSFQQNKLYHLSSYCQSLWLVVHWLKEDLNLVTYVNEVNKVCVRRFKGSDWLQYLVIMRKYSAHAQINNLIDTILHPQE